jgi:hypothetical protein
MARVAVKTLSPFSKLKKISLIAITALTWITHRCVDQGRPKGFRCLITKGARAVVTCQQTSLSSVVKLNTFHGTLPVL